MSESGRVSGLGTAEDTFELDLEYAQEECFQSVPSSPDPLPVKVMSSHYGTAPEENEVASPVLNRSLVTALYPIEEEGTSTQPGPVTVGQRASRRRD